MADKPPSFESWLDLARTKARVGQWAEALECAQRAASLRPAHSGSALLRAQCLVALGRHSEAHEIAIRLAEAAGEQPEWNDALGTLLTHCEDPARALPFFERAVLLAPARTDYLYNLAAAQRMTGDPRAAEGTLGRLIALAPGDIQAHFMRSDLRTQTADANHVSELQGLFRKGLPPHEQIMLSFALAKELEDLARYDESFSWLKRGCDLQRRMMTYNVLDDVAAMDRIVEVHTSEIVRSAVGVDSTGPIFVFGLPRSGTTLVEQILGSHSAVHAAGELQAFPLETVRAVTGRTGRAVGKLEFVERSCEVSPRELAEAYMRAAGSQTFSKSHFVDKQPLNYLYAGLIGRALPRSRLIAVAREPMDSCYSMYKSLFTHAYPFTYDLLDLGRYYVAWHRLVRHWQAVLADQLLIVQYEELVANQETVTRRMLAHCGLGWETACLKFHERQAAVTTASALQVRRPLYSHSVGRWRHFARHLTPLAEHLRGNEPVGGWRLA
jgi:tetratricopeptide (TPR) repeat protein